MSSSSRKWKTLLHKVEYLRLELEDRSEKIKEWERELTSELSKSEEPEEEEFPEGVEVEVVDKGSEEAPGDEEFLDSGGPQEDCPESMRKLWKQIAMKTHPDRTGGDPELTELYKKANSAWMKGELDVLLDVALELRIPMEEPDEATIAMLEKRADNLSGQIKEIENSVLWAWGSADESKKKAIEGAVKMNRKARRAAEAAARKAK